MKFSTKVYAEQVDRIADLLKERKKLERGGKFRQGWFDVTARLMKELQAASGRFPGYEIDILDDAYRQMIGW